MGIGETLPLVIFFCLLNVFSFSRTKSIKLKIPNQIHQPNLSDNYIKTQSTKPDVTTKFTETILQSKIYQRYIKQKDAEGRLELASLKKWRCSNMKHLKVQEPVQI